MWMFAVLEVRQGDQGRGLYRLQEAGRKLHLHEEVGRARPHNQV
jgi:hypothetical protein